MIGIKEATAKAIKYLSELYSEDTLQDIFLEGVKKTENKQDWIVTLSFVRSVLTAESPIERYAIPFLMKKQKLERFYRSIQIDGSTGDFIEMDFDKNNVSI